MRNARILALLVALCLSLASVASASSVGAKAVSNPGLAKPGASHSVAKPSLTCLYCGNTFFTGQTDAWTINYGYAVSDSFTVSSPGTMTNDGIASWQYPGDFMTGVSWAVGTAPDTANIASGTSATTDYFFFTNYWGYDIYVDRFNTGAVSLHPGPTYWLTLYNATTSYGYPAYWDINSGPSAAWESAIGYITPDICISYYPPNGGTCSDAFDISGSQRTIPEPGSLLLFGSGLLGLGGVIRRRLGR